MSQPTRTFEQLSAAILARLYTRGKPSPYFIRELLRILTLGDFTVAPEVILNRQFRGLDNLLFRYFGDDVELAKIYSDIPITLEWADKTPDEWKFLLLTDEKARDASLRAKAKTDMVG